MTTTVNRTTKFKSLHEFLQKKVKLPSRPPARSVLEQLVYAACLENTTYEAADAAFAVLEHYYIDWNEIRVSTAKELADTLPQLPEPLASGERIRRILHAVFNTENQFNLEELRKRGTSQAMEYLHSLQACTRFMADFMHQTVFGIHTIPVDERTMRVFRLLGLTKVLEDEGKEIVSGVERAILKNEGADFTARLHQFSAIHATDAKIENLRTLLRPLDPEAMSRPWAAPIFVNKPVKPKTPIRLMPTAGKTFLPTSFAVDEDEEGLTEFVAAPELEFIPHELPSLSEETGGKTSGKTPHSSTFAKTGGTARSKLPFVKPQKKTETKKTTNKDTIPRKEPEKSSNSSGDVKTSTPPPKTTTKLPIPTGKEKTQEPKRDKPQETGKEKPAGSTTISHPRRLQQKKPR